MKHGLLLFSALALTGACEQADKAGHSAADDKLPPGEVQLTGAGVEPRAVLRYQVPEGTTVTMDMVMKMSMTASGAAIPSIPPMRMTMTSTCTGVEPSGNMKFQVDVGEVTADGSGQMADAMAMAADMMKDMAYSFTLTPSGKMLDVQITGLTGPMAQMGTQMKDSIEQFAAPLPDEPVGKGSTWRFKRTAEANGIKMSTVNDFELLELKDGVATFKVKGRINAPKQQMEQQGVTVDVEKMSGQVTGTIANDLRRFAPAGTFTADMDMSMSAMGQKVKMSMAIESEITVR